MAGVRSWLQTLSRLVEENDSSDTLVALERWIEERPGYAVTFGRVAQQDGAMVHAVAIALPLKVMRHAGREFRPIQCSSPEGLNVALSDAMARVTQIEASISAAQKLSAEQQRQVFGAEQRQPSDALSVGAVLKSIQTQWGKPTA